MAYFATQPLYHGADPYCRLLGTSRQAPHLIGHNGKSTALLARSSRFDGGIQGQQIGLFGNAADHIGNGADLLAMGCDVYVRKDNGYNGNAPRLMLARNDGLGVTAETVIATSNLVSIDTWYSVSGSLPVATDDGVYEVYVDCNGTVGNIYVDDWAIT